MDYIDHHATFPLYTTYKTLFNSLLYSGNATYISISLVLLTIVYKYISYTTILVKLIYA
jgi:hypothetical protein